ncbi:MAG TPA: DUF190 domain-containing protein [Roseiflexaceae bacterium]|nr:DUF190 domain-containing protein [Roseiflexaceae bacterium]HMP40033.1 DUF190 domain-containing protein [Roseiflexaceae bacterium]
MQTNEAVRRVSIYLNERDMVNGEPLYLMTLERLRREGATGATAMRGIGGFGAGDRVRSAGMSDLSQSQPVVIEWIDRAERVGRILPLLDDLLASALITVEAVNVYRAVLRSSGPFGNRSIGEAAERAVVTVLPSVLLIDAVRRLLETGQSVLPVVDANRAFRGMLDASTTERYGLPKVQLLAALADDERNQLLAGLPDLTLAEVVQGESRTVYVESSIPQTVSTMIEWGLEVVPVVDRENLFVGIFGVEQSLRAALAAAPHETTSVRSADPPPAVHLVMQMLVPNVAASAPLSAALTQLLGTAARFLVVVDGGVPVGTLSDTGMLARLSGSARAAWLAAITRGGSLPADITAAVEGATAADMADAAPTTIAMHAGQNDAIESILQEQADWIAVVDEQQRLAGLVTRRGLMRALAQESVA